MSTKMFSNPNIENDHKMLHNDTFSDDNSFIGNYCFSNQTDSQHEEEDFQPFCTQNLLSWAFQIARGMEYLSQKKARIYFF